MTTGGEEVVIDRTQGVRGEYSDITFPASASAAGYNVVLVFPYSAGYTSMDGYATYGDEAKRLQFKFKQAERSAYLILKLPSMPGRTAHLRFKDGCEMPGTLYRLMVVAYN